MANIEDSFEDIQITGVIVEHVTEPRNDGTPGSALYSIPFELSRPAPREWAELFVQNWDHPPQFTSMHRPGIASVFSTKLVLNGTTMEEVERYHKATLQLALAETNKQYREWERRQREAQRRESEQRHQHRKAVADIASRISFD